MMNKSGILVSESAVRSLVKELLSNDPDLPAVVTEPPVRDPLVPLDANAAVDTTYRAQADLYSVPIGLELVPRDKAELEAVLKDYIVTVPDTSIPKLYHKLQQAFDEVLADGNEEGLTMKDNVAEQTIRESIRRIISEIGVEDRVAKGNAGRNMRTADVGGMTHAQMVEPLGYSGVPGVKREEFITLEKAKFWETLPLAKQNALLNQARRTYVNWLQKYADSTGEISAEEMQLIRSEPEMVHDLHGFRDWLDSYIGDAMGKGTGTAVRKMLRDAEKSLTDASAGKDVTGADLPDEDYFDDPLEDMGQKVRWFQDKGDEKTASAVQAQYPKVKQWRADKREKKWGDKMDADNAAAAEKGDADDADEFAPEPKKADKADKGEKKKSDKKDDKKKG